MQCSTDNYSRSGRFSATAMALAFVCLLLGLLFGLNQQANACPRPIKVVCSISPLANIVSSIGGAKVQVKYFVPPDADPHSFEPTFSALEDVSQAHLIFLNGDGLDHLAEDCVNNVKASACRVISLSNSIPQQEKNATDPHYFLDPKMAKLYVKAIAQALKEIDPEDAKEFDANANKFCQKLDDLDLRYRSLCQKLPQSRKGLVLYHNSWTYLAARYGFTVVGVVEESGEGEPSARHLAHLIRDARKAGAFAIVAEAEHGSKILNVIKEEARISRVIPTVEDSLSKAPYDTYLGMLEANLKQFASTDMN
jgi:ABC-type Zn uptake system ZnuABC Zn-binding protein ZnuA